MGRKEFHSVLNAQFWNQDVTSIRSPDGVARAMPGTSAPAAITTPSGISRSQQLLLLQKMANVPVAPSFCGALGGVVLDRAVASLGGKSWWATAMGRLKAQKVFAGDRSEIGRNLRDPSNYSLSAKGRLGLGSLGTVSGTAEFSSLEGMRWRSKAKRERAASRGTQAAAAGAAAGAGGVDEEGRPLPRLRLSWRKQLPFHELVAEASMLERCLNDASVYYNVSRMMTVDLRSKGERLGLFRYRLGVQKLSKQGAGVGILSLDDTTPASLSPAGSSPLINVSVAQAAVTMEKSVTLFGGRRGRAAPPARAPTFPTTTRPPPEKKAAAAAADGKKGKEKPKLPPPKPPPPPELDAAARAKQAEKDAREKAKTERARKAAATKRAKAARRRARRPYSALFSRSRLTVGFISGLVARAPITRSVRRSLPDGGSDGTSSAPRRSLAGTLESQDSAMWVPGGEGSAVPASSAPERDSHHSVASPRAMFREGGNLVRVSSRAVAAATMEGIQSSEKRLFGAAVASLHLGGFANPILDSTLLSARLDLSRTLDEITAPGMVSTAEPRRPQLTLSLGQQLLGPLRVTCDARLSLEREAGGGQWLQERLAARGWLHERWMADGDITLPPPLELVGELRAAKKEVVWGVDYALPQASGAARLVAWYSPTRREGMAEVRLLEK